MSDDTNTQDTTATATADTGMKVSYFFKTEKLVDTDGNEVGNGRKHPTVEAILPKPTAQDVIDILSKQDIPNAARTLVMEAIENIVFLAGRAQINEWREKNPEGTFTVNNFDLAKLSLEAIALLPKKQRGGYSPEDAELKAFAEDYKQVMLNAVGYDAKKVGVHVKNLEKGLVKLKGEKKILELLRGFLDTWAAHTTQMEEHAQVYEWLGERIAKWLKAEDKDLTEAF